jgi:D-serine deaminase-like pyridoxal phosphate-dependent protein
MNREFTVSAPERYKVANLGEIVTPRILFFEWAMLENLERIRRICGGSLGRLRLMAKTVKSSRMLAIYASNGMSKVKVSSTAEARAIARGASIMDILVAFPCLGPAVEDFLSLRREFPDRRFSTVVNTQQCAISLSKKADTPVEVFLDIDPGMRRTGIPLGREAVMLARLITETGNLRLLGLHVYDGNIHHSNPLTVTAHSAWLIREIGAVAAEVSRFAEIEEVVTSSSLTFASNLAEHANGGHKWPITVTPGTAALWDSNYNDLAPDAFVYAAAVAARIVDVVRHRDTHLITTDCGVKFGAATDCGRIHVADLRGYSHFGSSERFGQFEWIGVDRAAGEPLDSSFHKSVGDTILLYPRHVCTTLNQYAYGFLVRNGVAGERVEIDARDG